MEQFCDYRMIEERSVVEQAHEIQSFARELEHFSCMLPDKFVAGGIITKLPPSWISLALLMWKKRREKRTHVLEELREDLVPIWYRRTSSPTSSRKRARLMVKQNLRKNKAMQHTNFKKKNDKKKGVCHVGILIIGLLVALIAMRS